MLEPAPARFSAVHRARKTSIRTLLLCLPLLIGVTACAEVVEEEPAGPRRIIDMHLHALPLEAFPPHHDELAGRERPASDEEVMRRTLEALERFGVDWAITSGSPDLVAAYAAAAPDRIVPSLMIPAVISRQQLEELIAALPTLHEEGAFQVIGEVATQYLGIAPSDPILEPLFAFAAGAGVPVGLHMGPGPPGVMYEFAPGFRMRLGNPLELEEVLVHHPELKIYVMHAGYPRLGEMIALFSMYPQVHADLSVINWVYPRAAFHRYLRTLVEAGYGDRLMFGSDQMIWPQVYEAAVESIETADFLSEAQKEAIFYGNAARFLGLEGDDAPEGSR